MLKPFIPNHIGLFKTNSTKTVLADSPALSPAASGRTAPSHEIFGWWGIPIALVSGVLILVAHHAGHPRLPPPLAEGAAQPVTHSLITKKPGQRSLAARAILH